jgi:hypothetical protein
VFLGCPWSYSADIWNLGLMVKQTSCKSAYSYVCTLALTAADVEPFRRYQPVQPPCRRRR